MARETFEDQADAIRRVLKPGGTLTKADRQHLECAARNLDNFGAIRKKIVGFASSGLTDEQLDSLGDDIAQVLHIPIPGS